MSSKVSAEPGAQNPARSKSRRRDGRSRHSHHAEQDRLRLAFDSAGFGMAIADGTGRWVRVNPALCAMLGYEAKELCGRSPVELIPPDDALGYQADVQWLTTGAAPSVRRDVRFRRRDGGTVSASMAISLARDAHGERLFIHHVHDLSERQAELRAREERACRAAEGAQQAREAAEAANRAKSEFLTRVSHELNAPLNAVIALANTLRSNRRGMLDVQELSHAERIRDNGVYLLSLINDIADLTKAEAGRMTLDVGPVSLANLLQRTAALFEVQAASRGVDLRLEMPVAVAPIATDEGKLQQVLVKLLGNALRYTPRGSVTVRLTTDPATRRPARIEVIDTGLGIPAERIGTIFEAFEQADDGTSRRLGGTGLGLAISRSLCELMGYGLHVTSAPGAGSTFTIELGGAS